jgi:PAS domain S-box-containing protein
VIGRPFWDVRWWTISPETQQQLRQAITQAAAGEFVRYEVEVLGVGETTTIIDFSLKPVRNESGQVVLLIPEGRDISDRLRSERARRQIEAELRESEARLQLFVKHMPACVAMFDRDMRYVAVSDLWRASYSLGNEDLIGRSHYDLFPEMPEQWKTVHQRCLAGAIEICEEDIFHHADGSLDWVRWEMHPWYTNAKEIGGVILFCEVITKRKFAEQQLRKSEERLKVGVQVAEVAIAHFDYASNQVTLSPEAAVLYGFSTDQSVITREEIHATFHPEEREELLTTIQQVLDPAGAGWFAREHRVVWQTGEVRWLNVRKQVFFERSGERSRPSYAILAALDITARKQTEAEREQLLQESQAARQEAEAANRSKDDFMSLVAHELRTPVSAIMGWAKLLQMRQGDAAIFSKALKTIIRNSETQVQLIDDLLDACRLMYGTLQLKFASVNLVDVVEAAIETVRPTLEEKALRLEIRLNRVAPIWGDANRLQQVVLNLLTNSIKFTPTSGQVQVLLDQHDSLARIQVRDTGKGIDPEVLPHVFERFWQDQQTVTRKQGLGLGLSIVQYIVKQHNGTIQAESKGEGQGATFTVMLPLFEIEATAPEEASTPPADFIAPSLSGLRVLLVDDESDMLNLTAFTLEQAGAEVQAVQSAAAALEQFPQFQPDILISDIAMPEQDGYELLQQVRQLAPERPIPAIAFSAYSSNTRAEKSLQAGFVCHLTKPVEPKELVSVIWNVIQQRKV